MKCKLVDEKTRKTGESYYLFISEDQIPGISKKYAKKYLTTINFEEKKQE